MCVTKLVVIVCFLFFAQGYLGVFDVRRLIEIRRLILWVVREGQMKYRSKIFEVVGVGHVAVAYIEFL